MEMRGAYILAVLAVLCLVAGAAAALADHLGSFAFFIGVFLAIALGAEAYKTWKRNRG